MYAKLRRQKMFSELKNAYKLVQYGLSLKKQLAFAVGFALIGIVLEIVTQGRQAVGGFYILISGLFIYQLIISSDVSTLVQSSPYKKKIQCFYPIISVVPWTYVVFTLIAVIHGIFVKLGGEELTQTHAMNILLIGCFLFVTMIYFGVTYKFFVISTVIMCISITIPIMVVNTLARSGTALFDSYGRCVAISYVLLTVGSLISYLLSQIIYKYDLSEIAFRGMLGKKK